MRSIAMRSRPAPISRGAAWGAMAAGIRAQGRRYMALAPAISWGAGSNDRAAAGAGPAMMLAKACGSRP